MNVRRRWFLLFILLFLLLSSSPARSQPNPDAPWTKVLLNNTDANTAAALIDSGAQRLVDYGEFSLWSVPPVDPLALSIYDTSVEPLDENIYLRDIVISTNQVGFSQSPGQGVTPQPGEDTLGLWIVQFIGPILPEWQQALLDADLQIAAYIPNHAYLVWGSRPAAAIEEVSVATQAVQWSSPYLPVYRLAPDLRGSTTGPVDITVQLINTGQLDDTLTFISAQAQLIYQAPAPLLNTTYLSLRVDAAQLLQLAALPDVINIEPFRPPEMLDEIQGQVMAGNVGEISGALVASRPGYLQWLEEKGFPKLPNAYPLVDVIDDGLDNGSAQNILHPDFYLLGKPAAPSRVAYIRNCSSTASGSSVAGHGSLNAGILAGYNDRQGAPYEDANGYNLGLGISPYGPIAATKIFNNVGAFDMWNCPPGISRLPEMSYQNGARITSNSWGAENDLEYDIDALTYDIATRDASSTGGEQSMLHIFAAGNSGAAHGPISINSPGIAKNVLTVGAAENARDHLTLDGCLINNSDSVNDVAYFSSIGPTVGGRMKPDILAPGTHVQGPASLDPGFSGAKVCGSTNSRYYPVGQTLYTWSSGTSHSTPAVSGAAQLIFNYYSRVLNPGIEPSPAMVKALILNTPRYMTGEFAGDSLPSPYQGWGSINMGQIFDDTPRELVDQTIIFDRSGFAYETEFVRVFAGRSMHVSLVWTDAPGNPGAARALVNDLDLEIIYQGKVYYGNVFSGPSSVSGGKADRINNVENVFLPPGQSGRVLVRVIARNLAGDGIPNRPGLTDQDFALVVYNGSESTQLDNRLWFPLIGMGPSVP